MALILIAVGLSACSFAKPIGKYSELASSYNSIADQEDYSTRIATTPARTVSPTGAGDKVIVHTFNKQVTAIDITATRNQFVSDTPSKGTYSMAVMMAAATLMAHQDHLKLLTAAESTAKNMSKKTVNLGKAKAVLNGTDPKHWTCIITAK
ncbi:hypothetical protein [Lacticaseibacillus zhaodongensis]|uniref:hypothetical protein n=1 Tax=Lacticaseibacillus zhaodongensis TaxID=2668065 RepID=UPI0012D339D0|nr:hypothetical protein [Lacticaseibacillus zhaodongensis]